MTLGCHNFTRVDTRRKFYVQKSHLAGPQVPRPMGLRPQGPLEGKSFDRSRAARCAGPLPLPVAVFVAETE